VTHKRTFFYALILGILVAGLGVALAISRSRGDTSASNLVLLLGAAVAVCVALVVGFRSRPSTWEE